MKPVFRHKNLFFYFLICLLTAIFIPASGICAENSRNYRVVCLYKGSEGAAYNFNECLNMIGVPLHYLGIRIKYHDIESKILDDAEMKNYDAVISWFGNGEMKNAGEYCKFVKRTADKGVKYIIFENFGAYVDTAAGKKPVEMSVLNAAFGAVGFKYSGNWTADTKCVEIEYKDPAMCEFGVKYGANDPLFYTQFNVLNTSESQVFMKIKRRDLANSSSDVIFITKRGAMVLNTYAYFSSPDFKSKKWRVNPLLFLEKALGLSGGIRMDTTTKNGKRILFSHIDGDGFANISEIDRKTLCAEMIRDRIFKAFPQIKFSVSFITGQIDPAISKKPEFVEIARSICALSNIEAASHGLSHPHDWSKKIVNLQIPGYEFNYDHEIRLSIDFINKNIVPKGKETALMFWSGKCNPGEEAMTVITKNKLLNINGGDSKFDTTYNSTLFLRPPYINIGDGFQIMTPACNEVIYTNLFTANFGGYKKVIETFQSTERPRRLAPMDIYFHFFSGQKNETLGALLDVIKFALAQDPEFISASEYIKIINDFLTAEIVKTAPGVYEIKTAGNLPSVRFDDAGTELDMAKCKNVSGSKVINNSLYVSLDNSGDHIVAVKSGAKR